MLSLQIQFTVYSHTMSNVTNPLDHTRLYPEIWIRILAEISHEPQTFMLVRPEMTAKGHWLRLLPSRDHHVEVFELGRWGYWCSGCGSNDILNVAQVCHNWRNEIQRYRTRAFQVSGYRTEEKSPCKLSRLFFPHLYNSPRYMQHIQC